MSSSYLNQISGAPRLKARIVTTFAFAPVNVVPSHKPFAGIAPSLEFALALSQIRLLVIECDTQVSVMHTALIVFSGITSSCFELLTNSDKKLLESIRGRSQASVGIEHYGNRCWTRFDRCRCSKDTDDSRALRLFARILDPLAALSKFGSTHLAENEFRFDVGAEMESQYGKLKFDRQL